MNNKNIQTLALAAIMSGLGGIQFAYADAATIKNCGNEIVFEKKPERILSLGITGLAYLTSVDGLDKVVGRAVEYGESPSAWIGDKADKIDVISDFGIALEKIVALQPDLVYGGGFNSAERSPAALNKQGIKAIVDEPECHYFFPKQDIDESFEAIFKEMNRLSTLVGTEEKTKKNISELRIKLSEIEKKAQKNKKTVSYAYYFGKEDKALYSYGGQDVIKDINKTLGLKNVIDPNYHPHSGPLAVDAFIKSDPDVIIVLLGMGGVDKKTSMERLRNIPGFNDMRAVKSDSIYYADSALGYASPSAMYITLDLAKDMLKGNE